MFKILKELENGDTIVDIDKNSAAPNDDTLDDMISDDMISPEIQLMDKVVNIVVDNYMDFIFNKNENAVDNMMNDITKISQETDKKEIVSDSFIVSQITIYKTLEKIDEILDKKLLSASEPPKSASRALAKGLSANEPQKNALSELTKGLNEKNNNSDE